MYMNVCTQVLCIHQIQSSKQYYNCSKEAEYCLRAPLVWYGQVPAATCFASASVYDARASFIYCVTDSEDCKRLPNEGLDSLQHCWERQKNDSFLTWHTMPKSERTVWISPSHLVKKGAATGEHHNTSCIHLKQSQKRNQRKLKQTDWNPFPLCSSFYDPHRPRKCKLPGSK